MDRIGSIISNNYSGCLTLHIHSPHVYSTIPLSLRLRLISLRFRLVSSRRKMAAWEGLVLWRGLGGSHACWISRTNRSCVVEWLRSGERDWRDSILSILSSVTRLLTCLSKRALLYSEKPLPETSCFILSWARVCLISN